MLEMLASLILAYIIGSIPTSFVFAKLFKGTDIRKHGSGNVGATNVFRVVGKLPALFVLIIDILKGYLAVTLFSGVFMTNPILLGACAIAGHAWSVFLKFKGGKGVATTAGVLLALAPNVLVASLSIWILIFAIFKIVSVASIASSVFLPVFAILFNQSLNFVLFCVLICIIGTYKHKDNIRRLIRGEEKRLTSC